MSTPQQAPESALSEAFSGVAQKPFDDKFGNYLLHGMDEIYLAPPISWWPQTLAWKALALIIVLILCVWAFRSIQRWRKNKYRRDALAELVKIQRLSKQDPAQLSLVPALIKATALKVYPRRELARLTGNAWLTLLDKSLKGVFAGEAGEILLRVAYQPPEHWCLSKQQERSLFMESRRWLKYHAAGGAND